ncbi:hypothetical protein [Burkholderia latens]|uniref:hypothetical protein n=1 Tax=Burkholderia latens TaxID=488446 RepID=UPI001AE4C1A4|nr:hypothetical protein [Burkholderia latens]QTO51135.1 hypothetical protein J8I86_16960 [Burkholderia latens]
MTGIVPAAIDCFLIGMNVRPQRVENAGRLRVLQRGQRDALQRPLVNMRVGRVAIAAHSGWKSLFFCSRGGGLTANPPETLGISPCN